MKIFPPISSITPEQYERHVMQWLEAGAESLDSFQATHREKLQAADGEYEIDVVARYKVFGGANALLLVECKRHKNPIKRELVQALYAKRISLDADKAIMVSTASYQSGAIEFAQAHRVALVQIVSGHAAYVLPTWSPVPGGNWLSFQTTPRTSSGSSTA